jgi:hypothetical protein
LQVVSSVPGAGSIRPATVSFPQAGIDELRRRIAATRSASVAPAGRWRFGTGAEPLAATLSAWAQFDVEGLAARLNAVAQFDIDLDDVCVRVFVFRGEDKDALPGCPRPWTAEHGAGAVLARRSLGPSERAWRRSLRLL